MFKSFLAKLAEFLTPEPTQITRFAIQRHTIRDIYPDMSEEELKEKQKQSEEFWKNIYPESRIGKSRYEKKPCRKLDNEEESE